MDSSFLKIEEEKLSQKLGQKIILSLPEISQVEIERFEKIGFTLHYLPAIEITREKKFVNWQDYPKDNFFELIRKKRISSKVKILPGKWVFIDCRPKPAKDCFWITSDNFVLKVLSKFFKINIKQYYQKKSFQKYEDDFLLPILQNKGYASRFSLSCREVKESIIPSLAQFLKIDSQKIRLPRFVEWNFLGNFFYPQWGTTSTWEWFDDCFSTGECLAGGSNSLSILGWDPPDFWSTQLGFRLLIEI